MFVPGLRCLLSDMIVSKDRFQRLRDVDLGHETVDDFSEACLLKLKSVQKLFDMSRADQLRNAGGDGMCRDPPPPK